MSDWRNTEPKTAGDALAKAQRLLGLFNSKRRVGNAHAAKDIMKQLEETIGKGIAISKIRVPEAEPEAKEARKPIGEVSPEMAVSIEAAVSGARFEHGHVVDGGGHPFWDEVLPLFENYRADYLAIARKVAYLVAKRNGGTATVDDVRRLCPPPAEYDSRLMGAIFADKSTWRTGELVRSKRRDCHYRHIREFHLLKP